MLGSCEIKVSNIFIESAHIHILNERRKKPLSRGDWAFLTERECSRSFGVRQYSSLNLTGVRERIGSSIPVLRFKNWWNNPNTLRGGRLLRLQGLVTELRIVSSLRRGRSLRSSLNYSTDRNKRDCKWGISSVQMALTLSVLRKGGMLYSALLTPTSWRLVRCLREATSSQE